GRGDVGHLGPGGDRGVHHADQHLSRDNDGLARLVALPDYLLLDRRDRLYGHFDAQVAARHHYPVSLGEYQVEVPDRLSLLDLRDEERPVVREEPPEGSYVGRSPDERSSDEID